MSDGREKQSEIPGRASGDRKQYRRGTHRTVPPAHTLERVRPHRSAMGITRLANLTGLDRIGIPVVQCVRPNGRILSVSQGKGLDLHAAAASALMESVESFHAERVLAPLTFSSWAELVARATVVDVERLLRRAPSSFHAHLPILWCESVDLIGGGTCWVPFEVVHLDGRLPLPSGSGAFVLSSSGLASGNTMSEAITHALCELVERDAATLFELTDPATRVEVDLATVSDPDCRWLLDRFDEADVEVRIWNATSDLGVPTYKVVIDDLHPATFGADHRSEGWGTHLDRSIALSRALTEAAQSRLTAIAGSREDIEPAGYATASPTRRARAIERRAADRARRVRGDRHRSALDAGDTTETSQRPHFESQPTLVHDSVDADRDDLLRRLAVAGFEQVCAVDLTRPEFDIPVTKVIVPGLEDARRYSGYAFGARARSVIAAVDAERSATRAG